MVRLFSRIILVIPALMFLNHSYATQSPSHLILKGPTASITIAKEHANASTTLKDMIDDCSDEPIIPLKTIDDSLPLLKPYFQLAYEKSVQEIQEHLQIRSLDELAKIIAACDFLDIELVRNEAIKILAQKLVLERNIYRCLSDKKGSYNFNLSGTMNRALSQEMLKHMPGLKSQLLLRYILNRHTDCPSLARIANDPSIHIRDTYSFAGHEGRATIASGAFYMVISFTLELLQWYQQDITQPEQIALLQYINASIIHGNLLDEIKYPGITKINAPDSLKQLPSQQSLSQRAKTKWNNLSTITKNSIGIAGRLAAGYGIYLLAQKYPLSLAQINTVPLQVTKHMIDTLQLLSDKAIDDSRQVNLITGQCIALVANRAQAACTAATNSLGLNIIANGIQKITGYFEKIF